jgi:hypothetical protein
VSTNKEKAMTTSAAGFTTNPCTKHNEGAYHNCAYVEARNRLIPMAEQVANETPGAFNGSTRTARWDVAFHAEMDRLAAVTGLSNPNPRR